MSTLSSVWIVLITALTLSLAGCSDESDVHMRPVPIAASVLGGQADDPQEEETGPKEKKKGWREKLKETAGKGLKKSGEIAEAAEVMLGKEMKPFIIAQNGGVYPDPELHAYLEKIVLAMGPKTAEPDFPWEIAILNTSEMNSFALPGGKIFLTRGFITALESEGQVAHVVGHEMGHVVHRHLVRKCGLNTAREALVGAAGMAERKIFEKDPSDPVFVTEALGIGGHFAFLKFTRDQELQSDERGVDYALAAGYDPREAKRTFEMFLRLKEAAGQDETLLRGLLSTHPHDTDRIEKIDAYVQANYPEVALGERTLVTSTDAWKKHRDRLVRAGAAYDKHRRAMDIVAKASQAETHEGLEEALALLDQAIAEVPDHATLHFARGYVKYILGRAAEAEADLGRAITLDETHYQARLLRGLIRKDAERYEPAVEDLREAKSIHPLNPAPHFYLGECYEALGKKTDAKTSYRLAALLAPKGSKMKESATRKVASLGGGD